ncbi:MAG: type II toxin-antitoxin system VapC family toxin [Spirochaetaceae bacterium]|jgi:PIN domain nuclease of toxin-antitoxin system|nr:type II toxin-antitoxin system VapC family toxin [Spirochaetaceae bacterium]
MRLLLDTHTLLWSIGKSNELSEKIIRELKDVNNEVLVSAVSLWEIALKQSIGKLRLSQNPVGYGMHSKTETWEQLPSAMDFFDISNIPAYCEEMGFALIPLEAADALNSARLPQKSIHKDPFDRMLIYQCIKNGYVFASKDAKIKIYKEDGLQYIW